MSATSILINIGSQTGQAVRGINDVNNALGQQMTAAEKTKVALKKMMPVALASGAALVTAGTIAVKAASNQQQAYGALDSILGKNADSTKAWAAEQAKIGLSTTDAANSVALLSSQLKNQGNSTKEAAAKSRELVELGADLAATFGGSTADAVAALSSALKGEMDPIEKYGISLNDAALKAQAMEMGIYSGKGALDAQAKSLATQALLWEQSADAQGQAAREADTVAGSMATLQANTANATAALGEALLPIVATVMEKLAGFAAWAQQNTGTVQAIAAVIGVIAAAIIALNVAMTIWTAVTTAWTVVTAIATAVGAAFGAVMAVITSPVTLVILAILALIAIVVLLWKNWDTVTKALGIAWQWLKTTAISVFNAIKTFLAGVWNSIKSAVLSVWNSIKSFLSGAWNTIKNTAIAAFNALKAKISEIFTNIKTTISNKITEVIALVKGLPGKILNAIGNLGSLLYDAGRDLIQGLINGIKSLIGNIGSTIRNGIPSWVPGFGGRSVTPSAAGVGALGVGALGAPAGGFRAAPVTINVTTADPAGTARVIKRALEGNDLRQGRARGRPLAVAW